MLLGGGRALLLEIAHPVVAVWRGRALRLSTRSLRALAANPRGDERPSPFGIGPRPSTRCGPSRAPTRGFTAASPRDIGRFSGRSALRRPRSGCHVLGMGQPGRHRRRDVPLLRRRSARRRRGGLLRGSAAASRDCSGFPPRCSRLPGRTSRAGSPRHGRRATSLAVDAADPRNRRRGVEPTRRRTANAKLMRLLSAALLPERLRAAYGLDWGAAESGPLRGSGGVGARTAGAVRSGRRPIPILARVSAASRTGSWQRWWIRTKTKNRRASSTA